MTYPYPPPPALSTPFVDASEDLNPYDGVEEESTSHASHDDGVADGAAVWKDTTSESPLHPDIGPLVQQASKIPVPAGKPLKDELPPSPKPDADVPDDVEDEAVSSRLPSANARQSKTFNVARLVSLYTKRDSTPEPSARGPAPQSPVRLSNFGFNAKGSPRMGANRRVTFVQSFETIVV